jgi:hypothetical protein
VPYVSRLAQRKKWSRETGSVLISRRYSQQASPPRSHANSRAVPHVENCLLPRKLTLDSGFPFAILALLPYQQRLSRVVEGTGPKTPQQPGANAKVLIPASVGER